MPPSGDANLSNQVSGVHAGSSLHVYSECNVASLCEEALDVVCLAFRQSSGNNTPTVTPLTELRMSSPTQIGASIEEAVSVDFTASSDDWLFLCSPGAIRRIVMNLVGNSLKYTRTGSISVNIGLKKRGSIPDFAGRRNQQDSILVLTVVDTGQGMSDDFLKRKLFVPFSQEATLAAGSGLGLSLVQGIIKSLHGLIDVWSDVGKGTKVEVKIPLSRSSKHLLKVPGPNSSSQASPKLNLWCRNKTYRLSGSGPTLHAGIRRSLRLYMQEWWGIREVGSMESSDIVFLCEKDLVQFLEANHTSISSRHAIILFTVAPILDVRSIRSDGIGSFEPLVLPFGPQKLSKALQACLDQSIEFPMSNQNLKPPNLPKESLVAPEAALRTGNPPMRALRPSLDRNARHQFTEQNIQTSTLGISSLSIRGAPVSYQGSRIPMSQTGRPRVLCVEDNTINLKLLLTYTRKLGFENVEAAENGLLAFEAVERCKEGFDVIFMGEI